MPALGIDATKELVKQLAALWANVNALNEKVNALIDPAAPIDPSTPISADAINNLIDQKLKASVDDAIGRIALAVDQVITFRIENEIDGIVNQKLTEKIGTADYRPVEGDAAYFEPATLIAPDNDADADSIVNLDDSDVDLNDSDVDRGDFDVERDDSDSDSDSDGAPVIDDSPIFDP